MNDQSSGLPSIPQARFARTAAYIGVAAALGYATLKAIWGGGGTIGVNGTPVWHDELSSLTWILASWGTVALAALAAGILLALVQGWGRAGPRRALRALAWTGCVVMTTVGLIGTGEVLAYAAGLVDMSADEPGDLAPAVYGYVYGSFLVLGVAFGLTAWATRPSRRPRDRPGLAEQSR
ncbi:MAG: hypothetical protein M3417_04010 [Actinomycetota bacterium]|nr:hypothetical protein [Actinomycetota bacterium]